MTSVIGGSIVGLGVALMLLAAIGILRLPDVLIRASAATKAAGLGVALVLGGVAILFGTPEAVVKLSIAVVLQFITAPVAGHVLGRAAYRSGAPLWEGTHHDDLRGFYARRSDVQPELPGPSASREHPTGPEDGTNDGGRSLR